MEIFNAKLAQGDVFVLARTNQKHYASRKDLDAQVAGLSPRKEIAAQSITGNTGTVNVPFDTGDGSTFREQLFSSLQKVNSYQQEIDRLSVQSLLDPDSVDSHDVSIAAAKAQLTLNITKNVMNRVVQSYMSIINTR